MSDAELEVDTDRLRRLLGDQLEECCDSDVDARVTELRALDRETAAPGDDLTALRALGGETRYRLARLLAAGGERCVCELAPLVDVSESAVSHALSSLADAGLVERRKAGRWRYYRATDRTTALLNALDTTREVPA
ncbi:ArsR/SmtB family transcription factor [Haloglomus litoreum]|uniref:ArsR/SmtB family transcription factor n=1 Tax=Haloglomus litoreum TaxID=3034026 RepID=UPI0023E81F97|nr:metalloregulator ArsR/SmtB family transcription factor [Haloglomus sp. DT116]